MLSEGQPIMTLLADDEARLPAAIAELEGSWEIGGELMDRHPLIITRIAP